MERFLARGFRSLPPKLAARVPHLRCWSGVAGFRRALGRFVQQPQGLPTYCFGQSTALIRFAAESLFAKAHRVLVTDLAWPPYAQALRNVARAKGRQLCLVRLRNIVMADAATKADVVRHLHEAYQSNRCDGLFLSDVTYLGTKLPVQDVLVELSGTRSFAVIDGAQAVHQCPINLSELNCDLYLAGTQKWLGSYHPLRLAFVGRQSNRRAINDVVRRFHKHNPDALFNFCRSMEDHEFAPYGETVNLSPLIAAAGALYQAQYAADSYHDLWQVLRTNAMSLADWMDNRHWRPAKLHASLGSGILMLTPTKRTRAQFGSVSRRSLARRGIIASSFPDGALRLSMLRFYLSLHQHALILQALCSLHNPPPVTEPDNASSPAAGPL